MDVLEAVRGFRETFRKLSWRYWTNPVAVELDELPIEIQVNLRAANLHVNQISETKDLSIKGHCYRPGCVLVLDYNNFWPSYGVVDKILVIDYQKFFLLTRLKVMEYDHHYLLLCKTFRYKASSEIPRSQVCLASVYS